MNELGLIERIIKNPEVFGEVITMYEQKLLRYIMRISGVSYEEAENILQEVFIRAYRYINEYDKRYSFSSWIYRIAHNIVIDTYRKNKKESAIISIDDEEYSGVIQSLSDGNTPQMDLQKKEIKSCVQKAISLLTPEYREVIVLRCLEQNTYEEISDILQIPIGSASTLVNRAKKQLRDILQRLQCNS